MTRELDAHAFARLWAISVSAMAVAITVNHVPALGAKAILLGTVVMLAAIGSLLWFQRRKSRVALAAYVLVNLWIVVGFGLVKGLWAGILRLFLGSLLASRFTQFPRPPLGTFAFEASGILMFVGAGFVAWTAHGFAHAVRSRKECPPDGVSPRAHRAIGAGLAAAALLVVGAYALTHRDRWTPPKNGVVRVGVIAPVTGSYSLLGGSFVKAIQLASDEQRATKYRYELVVRDSGPDPKRAREVIRELVEGQRVDAILGGISIIGQVTQPIAEKARIPHLCVCTVTSIGDGNYNFTNIPSPEDEAKLWVTEALRRGIRTVAILSQSYPSIRNHVDALKNEAVRNGVRIVDEQEFEASTSDFRAVIARVAAASPDVYYVEAFDPALDLLGRQLADAKIRNIASVVAPSLSGSPRLFEGAWYTDSNLADRSFRKRFEARYPDTPFATHMMPYAYDNFRTLVQAFESEENPAVFIRDLESFDGTAGLLIKAPGTGNFRSTPAVWVIRNGKPELQSGS